MPALSLSVFTQAFLRLGRYLAHLALLASLGVLAILPAFDHHAAEYNPWHGHLSFGVADLPDHHDHPYTQPHTHAARANTATPLKGVVFTANPLSGVVSFLAAFDQVLPPLWLALLPLAVLWLVVAAPRLAPRLSPLSLLDPPPRLALD